MHEELAPMEQSVSLSFRDKETGKLKLQIFAAVTDEERDKIKEDKTGELLINHVVSHVFHHLKIKDAKIDVAPYVPVNKDAE
jgi:hypothetical protein